MEKVKRTKVVDLLKSTAYDSIVNVKGWVRTHRSSKAVDFIALNDGSTINNIQIVVDPSKVDENQLRQITTTEVLLGQTCKLYTVQLGYTITKALEDTANDTVLAAVNLDAYL